MNSGIIKKSSVSKTPKLMNFKKIYGIMLLTKVISMTFLGNRTSSINQHSSSVKQMS